MENGYKDYGTGTRGVIVDVFYPTLIRILTGSLIIVLCV